jgi:diguanylate cyclase (GGDEF)-like protein
MGESSLANRVTLPDTSYTRELSRGVASRSFDGPLEAEYQRTRLQEDRTMMLVLAGMRGAEQILSSAWSVIVICQFAVSLGISMVLAVMAFTPWFERSYPSLAQVLVPIRNPLVAVMVASTAANGHLESLMLLPLLVIGPFFVHGLRVRAALLAVVASFAAFLVSALLFWLPWLVIARSSVLIVIVGAACGLVALHRERTSRRSFLESRLIADLAQRDALTGLNNRRVLDERMEDLWKQCVDRGRALTVMLIDVDHFKAYNDRYGHQAGDHALQRVAAMLQTFVTRPNDVLARYGGEEFAALFYDLEPFDAEDLAQRMRRAVGTLALDNLGKPGASAITISVGVAVVEPSEKRRARGALQLADQALYQAKIKGRNRVEMLDQSVYQALETGVFSATFSARH